MNEGEYLEVTEMLKEAFNLYKLLTIKFFM